MTGSDEGGFRPHPGDPWHPGWSDDGETADDVEATDSDLTVSESTGAEKKQKRRGRRGRRAAAAADEAASSDFDPSTTAFDTDSDDASTQEDSIAPGEDPFDAVLDREASVSRHQRGEEDEAPSPAWTGDREPDPDHVVPVEQPSWVGESTGVTSGVEAVGFEAAGAEGPEDDTTLDSSDGVDVVGPADEGTGVVTEEQPPLIGEYGVAGPEAFDALQADDASSGELDDWDAFMAGSPVPSESVGDESPAGADAQVASSADESDHWIEPVPEKRRGRFRRRKKERADEADVSFAGSPIEDPTPAAVEESIQPGLVKPAEQAADGEAFDDWDDPEPKRRRGLFRRGQRERVDDGVDGSAVETGWIDGAAVAETNGAAPGIGAADALSVEPEDGTDRQPVPGAEVEPEGGAGDVADALGALAAGSAYAADVVGAVPDPVSTDEGVSRLEPDAGTSSPEQGLQPGLFEEEPLVEKASVPGSDTSALQIEPVKAEDGGAPDSDPGRVPAGWFAEIDEDDVVPPPVSESPETEWPDAEIPRDVFDIEDPEPDPGGDQAGGAVSLPDSAVPIPEGYQAWEDAVADAVGGGADAAEQPLDDGTFEYDQPLQTSVPSSDDPSAGSLPAGFEAFPGRPDMEQFDLPEEALRAEMSTNDIDDGWVTDDIDSGQMPTEEMDAPLLAGGNELDEQRYEAGATIEHRDLAAAIAEAGDNDTQWEAVSAAMPGLETGVVGFGDVADLGTGGDYVATTRSDLGVRVATGLALAGLLFGSIFVSDVAFAGFIGVIVMLGLAEFFGALRRTGYLPLGLFALLGGVGILVSVWFHGPLAIPAGVLLTSMVTFFFYAFSPTRRDALANAGLTILGVGWVIAPVAFVIPIARAEDHVVLIFAIVAVTAATDIGAFSFGKAWGRSPLAPILSPNKTAEGLAGGVMLSLIVGSAIGFFELGPFDLKSGVALGAIAMFFAPLGDLAESMIKRSLGIKDMGSILPGHGGILDRIDAFLFVIPAAWVLYEAIGFLG